MNAVRRRGTSVYRFTVVPKAQIEEQTRNSLVGVLLGKQIMTMVFCTSNNLSQIKENS